MSNQYFIGVDIGGTNVDALLVDEALANEVFMTAPIRPGDGTRPIDVIISLVEQLLAKGGINDWSSIKAIGVGVPGLVDAETGVVELAVNLDEKSMNLGDILQTHFGCPAFIENDANAVALGAMHFLVDSSIKNLAFFTIGTGVGSGLVLNGKIFHGSKNMAGEVGHMFIKENNVRCQCGANGCLETFVAGPAIGRMAREATQNGTTTSLSKHTHLDAAAVFTEADAGDAVAIEIVREVSLVLARALQGMIMSFDLEKIIIGGGISRAGDSLLNPILDEWEKMRADSVMAESMLQPDKLMMCPPDFRAGAWGAVAVALAQSVQQNEPMVLAQPS